MPRVKGSASLEILYKLASLCNFSVAMRKSGSYGWNEVLRRLEIMDAKERTVKDAFYYLKKKKLIAGEVVDNQLYIRLTPAGEKEAGKYQINKLKIKRQKNWDKKWRLIIFDIPEDRRIKREAFRGKLKEFNFYRLQKSVWVYPYPCEAEIKLLREFFNLQPRHLRIFEVFQLEEDRFLRDFYKLGGRAEDDDVPVPPRA